MPAIGLERLSFNINLGKRKKRSQMNEVFTDDGRIVPTEHDVLRGCMDDDVKGLAYLIDADNQLTNENGDWTQLIGERSMIPICLIKPSNVTDLKSLKNRIFHETHEAAKIEQYNKAKQNDIFNKVLWIITIPSVTFLLFYVINTWRG